MTEQIEMHAPEIEQPPQKRRMPKWTKTVFGFGIFALCSIFISRCVAEKNMRNVIDTKAVAPSGGNALSAINVEEQTEEYQKNLKRYTQEKIEESSRTGKSFVPPASGGSHLYEDAPGPSRKKESYSQPTATAPPRLDRGQKGDPALLAYLAGVESRLAASPTGQTAMTHNQPRSLRQGPPATPAGAVPDAPPGLRAGDILYAVNNITLDSDAPGPVLARIVDNSRYKGAKAIGAFKRNGGHLTLEFDTLVAADGVAYNIKGVAIDPKTDRTAVRSSIDNHMFERWFGLAASSFLQGLGQAVGQSGRTTYAGVYGSASTLPKYEFSEQALIAGGKVGERMANIFERNFDRPPTVVLQSGVEVGILIISATQSSSPQGTVSKSRTTSAYNPNVR